MTTPEDIRTRIARGRRWVVKIGSALATNDGVGLNHDAIAAWCAELAELAGDGRQIVLVTSGSVAEGAARLGWTSRPHVLNQLQAAAAVGQAGLVTAWDQACRGHGRRVAQVLLTHEDLADRQRYLNARSTLLTLLELGALPIVNENDTVATAEISLGDNDTLAGLVSNLVDADVLVVLTDQPGLMTADPRRDPAATLIPEARVDDRTLEAVVGDGGDWGRGGMRTKLRAARLAARSATPTVIAAGQHAGVLRAVGRGEPVGTLLYSAREKIAARKQWLAVSMRPQGTLTLDEGAERALCSQGKSLLAVGVRAVNGTFSRGELVTLLAADGRELGRGLVNYAAAECRQIAGLPSGQIESVLGFVREPELVHRDNLVLEAEPG